MVYHLLKDCELLQFLKEDDSMAFREIYVRYFKKLFLSAYQKVRSKEVAEEMVQNLFVSLWERRLELNVLNLKSYLLSSIKFSVINYFKSQIVEEKYINYKKGNYIDSELTTEHFINMKDISASIDTGVSLLPEKTQQVFKLSRVEGFTIKEISKSLKISEKAVEYHITQSLKMLKYHLKDYITILLCLFSFSSNHL